MIQVSDDLQRTKNALLLWAEWMEHDSNKLGYPSRSLGIASCAGHDFDDLCESGDGYLVQCTDTAVNDLEPHESAAISHCYLSAVFFFRRLNYSDVLAIAHDKITASLKRKGALG